MNSERANGLDAREADIAASKQSGYGQPGFELTVERGPDCIMVRMSEKADAKLQATDLSEMLWTLLEHHMVNRLVLDLNEIVLLHSLLVGQLIAVRKQIAKRGGTLRLCGLSDSNQRVLHKHQLTSRLPHYASRREAVCDRHLR